MSTVTNRSWYSFRAAFVNAIRSILERNMTIKSCLHNVDEWIEKSLNNNSNNKLNKAFDPAEKQAAKFITSRLCTESDFHTQWYQYWRNILGYKPSNLHRKIWEYIVIVQALNERNMLKPGMKGLGFGVGKELLPSLFASFGCQVVATDIGSETDQGKLWQKTNSNLLNLNDLYYSRLCSLADFNKCVSCQAVNMNAIPSTLTDFDFTWSICAFEHLGSITNGMNFILNQMNCIKKGGWAVHTTEFNLSSNDDTLENEACVIFRRKDIEHLINELKGKGYFVEALDTSIGSMKNDFIVDQYPYDINRSIRLKMGNYVATSLVLVIRK